MKKLLFDADSLLYKAFYGYNKNKDKSTLEIENYIIRVIDESLKNTSTDSVLMCFSDIKSYRYNILRSYKFNRSNIENNNLNDIKDFIKKMYKYIEIEELEADDIISIYMTKYPKDYKIASIDKDLKQIKGVLYNFDKKTKEYNDEIKARNNFYLQCIIGDSTDFLSGIPGIGEKRSEEIFNNCIKDCKNDNDFFTKLLKWYEFFGLNKDYMLKQIRCIKLLDNKLYDLETKKITLYNY